MARKDRRKAFARRLAAPGMALALGAGPACASDILDDQTYQIRNLYGEVGLIDMPGAHMADDGQITVSVSALKDTQRYGFSFQALPWLEGSFRYSHLSGLFGSNYYDRSFGVKLRLFEETADTPDISLGHPRRHRHGHLWLGISRGEQAHIQRFRRHRWHGLGAAR